eukprot:1389155-Ditylum_brightwellii.AAC.1
MVVDVGVVLEIVLVAVVVVKTGVVTKAVVLEKVVAKAVVVVKIGNTRRHQKRKMMGKEVKSESDDDDDDDDDDDRGFTSVSIKNADVSNQKNVTDVEASSVDSLLCNIDYDTMNEKVEEVISNFRIFVESMKKKNSTKDKCYSARNKFCEQKTRKKTWYAACTLQYYPVANDDDDETKDRYALILNENEKDSNDDEDSIADDENSSIKDGVFVFYHVTIDRSMKEMFLQCRQFNVSYPYYIRLGLKLICIVEKGQVKDWNKVKRNVKECAEMEGAKTKGNKPLQIAIDAFIKELGLWQFSGESKQVTAKICFDAFWEKKASAKIIRDGHKCKEFIVKESSSFSLPEVSSNGGEIVYGHILARTT